MTARPVLPHRKYTDSFKVTIVSFCGQWSTFHLASDARLDVIFKQYAEEHGLQLERLMFRFNTTDVDPTESVKLRDLSLQHDIVLYASVREQNCDMTLELDGQEMGGW